MGKDLKGKELGEGLTQRKDKKYLARFTSITGKRCNKVFDRLQDAKQWMVEAAYDDCHHQAGLSNSTTVSEWFKFWLDNVKGGTLRSGSRQLYENRYKAHIAPVIGKMIITSVKPVHCQAVLNHAAEQDEALCTVKKLRSILFSIFKSAVENDLIVTNPVTSSVKAHGQESHERKVLTIEEQKLFVEEAHKTPYGNDFEFVLETGLRVGELMGLRWSDVDLKNDCITVNRTIVFEKGGHQEHPPKTKAGRRTIPLTTQAKKILLKQQGKIGDGPIPLNGTVFVNQHGQPVFKHIYNRWLSKISSKIEIEHVSMHCLRHTFATRCIEAGMKPKTLQKILGHSNISMTMDLYVHITDDELKSEMKKLELNIV